MPPSRRSTAPRPTPSTGRQSTLSFGQRVTKNVPKSAKDTVISPSVAKQPLLEKEEQQQAKPEDVEDDDVRARDESIELEKPEPVKVKVAPKKTKDELRAEKVSNAAVERYWRSLESQRSAKQIHVEDLSTGEMVLRYFDVSSQYGPCIGIARIKRWHRAQRLGLNPPIEVLAVLLKEEAQGNDGIERAHMDEIMNPSANDP